MRYKKQLKKILAYALLTLAMYILQVFVFPLIPIFGVMPLVLPLAAIGAGFLEGGFFGGIYGLVCGLVCDSAFHTAGIFTFALAVLGMLAGLMAEFVLLRGLPAFLLCALAGLLGIAFLQLFPLLVFSHAEPLPILLTAGAQTLYSLVLALPLYPLLRLMARRREKRRDAK